MNKCRVTKKLSGYIDNQLSQREKSEVEMHLEQCKVCELELDKLRQISEKLKAWHAPGLDADFDRAVKNKIVAWELERGQVKMKKKTLAILIPSSALAGILVIVFLGSLLQVYKRGFRGSLGGSPDERMGEVFTGTKFDGGAHVNDRLMNKGGEVKAPQYQKTTTSAVEIIPNEDNSKMVEIMNFKGVNFNKEIAMASGRAITGVPVREYKGKSFKDGDDYSQGQSYAFGALSLAAKQVPTSTAVDKSILAQGQIPSNPEGSVIVIQPTIPATGEGDQIIRTGFIQVEVENGKETYNKALEICNELGGYMAGSNFSKTKEGKEAGRITMRIPKEKFTIALDKLSSLGKVENIHTDSQDVSQEYANLKAQLDATMVVYNKMLEALQKKNVTIPDAVRLESELTPVLKRVEDLKNKIEYLNKSVAYTTVNFAFYEKTASFKTLKESKRFIQESMIISAIKAVKFTAAAIPVLIVAIVLLGIIVILVLAVKEWIKQLLKRGQ